MSARLPSWFWLLVCVTSFAGSLLAWSLERRGGNPVAYVDGQAMPMEGSTDVADSTLTPQDDVTGLSRLPADAPANERAAPTAFSAPPLSEAGAGTRVLRCAVQGRITYIDASAACPDGSAGKITVLPN